MPNHVWNPFPYGQDDPSEAFSAAEAPTDNESEQTVYDLNITGGENSDHNSSTETAISTSTDDGCAEVEIKSVEFKSFATDYLKFRRKQTFYESEDIEANRQFRSSTDKNRSNSPLLDFEDGFNMKLFLFDMISLICGFLISNLAIAFGAGNIGRCPADLCLPYLVLVMGLLGLCIVSYILVTTNKENFEGLKENERNFIAVSSWLLFFLWMWEVGHFFYMDVSFDSTAKNYCNHAFYTFTIVMNIFTALGFFIEISLFSLDTNRSTSSPTRSGYLWLKC